MEQTLFVLRGLPACGKSTWALDFIKAHSTDEHPVIRVEKDIIRAECFPNYQRKDEKEVIRVRDGLIIASLKRGCSVISSDTNLNPVHIKRLEEIARSMGVKFEIVDLTAVPYWECIKRDALRPNSVGEKVISQMYFQWIKPNLPKQPQGVEKVVICDLDGTIALLNGRDAVSQQHLCGNDLVNPAVENIIRNCGLRVIFTSGRSAKVRHETELWLLKHNLYGNNDLLLMRPESDSRPDNIVKKELYQQHIEGRFHVLYALDDRSVVCELWRSLGITCLQVDYGNF